MCSRPCPRNPVRYERGEPMSWLPPMVSCCCLLLPTVPFAICADSKSRVRKDVRVQVPPPAPTANERASSSNGSCPFSMRLVLERGSNPLWVAAWQGGRRARGHFTPGRNALPGVPPTADNIFRDRHEGHQASSELRPRLRNNVSAGVPEKTGCLHGVCGPFGYCLQSCLPRASILR